MKIRIKEIHMDILTLIIQAVCGAIGANITGKAIKKIDLGVLWNSVSGIIGGGLGGQLLNMLGVATVSGGSPDLISILSNVGSGAVGGGVLMVIVGLIKKALSK